MRKKRTGLFFAAMTVGFMTAGCGTQNNIVLTPYGDAIIENEGLSLKTKSAAEEKSFAKESGDAESDSKNGQNSGNEKTGSNKGSGGSSGTDHDTTGLLHVGFAQVGAESGWRLAQTQSMKDTFSEKNGYLFDFVDCNNNQKTQLEALEQFIESDVDYIILDPIVEDGYDEVLGKAKDAGIPVIVVDREISADDSLYTCWVGSDFTKEGSDAAEWLANYLTENAKTQEEINILTILGTAGASAATGRTAGFELVAENQKTWKMLDKQTGDFTKDGGYAVMKAYLNKYEDIDVVVCQNDDEAFGAVEAIKEAGRTCGPNGDIIIVSFDATRAGFQAMIDGDINVDVECNPLEGPFVAALIQKLQNGEAVDKIQYMEEHVFTAEEAEAVLPGRMY